MANDIERTLESLPGWALPALIIGVVLVAALSKKSGGGGGYNTVVYGPAPVDPGIISLQQTEIEAKQGLYQTAINAFISRDIQSGANDRDVHLARIGADVENQRTRAAEGVAIAQSADNTRATIFQAQTAGRIVDSQGATQKYVAKKQAQASIWNGITNTVGNVIKSALPFI